MYLQVYPTGGSVQSNVWETLQKFLSENKSCVLVTQLIDGQSTSTLVDSRFNLIGPPLPDEVLVSVKDAYSQRRNDSLTVEGIQYFIQVFSKRSRLLIIGAAHITADLVRLAALYDFETWVIDPRGAFTNNTQFVVAPDQLLEKYPSEVLDEIELDEYTYAVILSHDPKIDDNALGILLRSNVAYIGALGSRKTHEKRTERLKRSGFSDEEIVRIESPIGMDIHARGAREIALSIMASLIRIKNKHLT